MYAIKEELYQNIMHTNQLAVYIVLDIVNNWKESSQQYFEKNEAINYLPINNIK